MKIERRPGFWIPNVLAGLATVTVVVLVAAIVVGSGRVRWSVIIEYFMAPAILWGVGNTLMLTLISLVGSLALGTLLAAMRLSNSLVFNWIASAYIWFFRGTPLLVQVVFWFNFGLFLPQLTLFGSTFLTNNLITPLSAALLGLLLNVSAFMCEVIRGGLISVDRGQTEAALSIGMTPIKALLKIVLPQAVRVIVPAAGNLAIDLLKATSLVYIIGTREILGTTQSIAAQNFYVIEMLIIASLWYLLLVTVASLLQAKLETRLAQSVTAPTVRPIKVM